MLLTFIHITDSHVGEKPETLTNFYGAGAALKEVLNHIARNRGHGASFIAHTGDLICSWARPEGYEGAKAIYGLKGSAAAPGPLTVTAAGVDLPWYYIPGNSDNRRECLARLFPNSPPTEAFNYAWQLKGLRFLSLDWAAERTNNYTLRPETYEWLAEQLKSRTPTVILTHHPPVHVGVEIFDSMTPTDLQRLQELIDRSSVIAILHGHTHYPWDNRIGAIPVFGTGSVTFRRSLFNEALEIHPPQYRVVTINDDGSVSATIHEVPFPE